MPLTIGSKTLTQIARGAKRMSHIRCSTRVSALAIIVSGTYLILLMGIISCEAAVFEALEVVDAMTPQWLKGPANEQRRKVCETLT